MHHGTHRRLLHEVPAEEAPVGDFDAVIVPTNRPPGKYLQDAAYLARELGYLVVALCSGSATAHDAAAVGDAVGARVLAIDVAGLSGVLPTLWTSALWRRSEFTRFHVASDLSAKRNLGLLLAHVTGWERVLFLDDDIARRRLSDIRAAAGLLSSYSVVGLQNDGFPDNSVVCHAYKAVGGKQETFIGGGAMAVAPAAVPSFFPDIYNEDWLYLHGALPTGQVAVTGAVSQKRYDPFASPRRASVEEFGDCLGEGLYRLLDDGHGLEQADGRFWLDFLTGRRQLIEWALDGVARRRDEPRSHRMILSLSAALAASASITPKLCLDYLSAWRADQARWREHLASRPRGLVLGKALAELGLASRHVSSKLASEDLSRGWLAR